MSRAYLVGTLRREDRSAPYTLVSVGIYSESSWGLTQVGDGALHVELAPPTEGKTFAEARDEMAKNAKFWKPQLRHLFDFEEG